MKNGSRSFRIPIFCHSYHKLYKTEQVPVAPAYKKKLTTFNFSTGTTNSGTPHRIPRRKIPRSRNLLILISPSPRSCHTSFSSSWIPPSPIRYIQKRSRTTVFDAISDREAFSRSHVLRLPDTMFCTDRIFLTDLHSALHRNSGSCQSRHRPPWVLPQSV